ncbi:MAG: Hsp20/alpha crystallin family protein [bacterium]
MALIPWRETYPLAVLRSEMDSVFDHLFDLATGHEFDPWEGFVFKTPAVDMEETDKEIIVKAEMPGLEPRDFQISLADNILTIKGEKNEEKKEEKKNYHMIERRHGSFYRSIMLPFDVKGDKVEANYSKGILEIKLPKTGPKKAKKITIPVK